MDRHWLTALSFERTHDILSAINTLSLHAKLRLAGISDPADEAEIKQAEMRLLDFVARFEALLREAEQHRDGSIMGADPRLGDLAVRFLAAKRRWPQQSTLFTVPLAKLREIVGSERHEDLLVLVSCLRGLRSLLEQHSHADVTGILDESSKSVIVGEPDRI